MSHVNGADETNNPGGSMTEFSAFVEIHKVQLESCRIPQIYWPTLHKKLEEEIFDAGEHFQIYKVEDNEGRHRWKVVATTDVNPSDPDQIYLIDHAWTYRVKDCRQQLQLIPGLLDRMTSLMEIDTEDKTSEEVIEDVLQEMWRYNQTYRIGNYNLDTEEAAPIWYIMDEFGSRIQHSDSPTFRTAPFYFAPSQLTFTLLWPIQPVQEDDEVTRNFVTSNQNSEQRPASLLPWIQSDFTHIDYKQTEPDPSYSLFSIIKDTVPSPDTKMADPPKDCKMKVFTEVSNIEQFLTDPRFEFITSQEAADILWLSSTNWTNFKEYPDKYVNQFPYEAMLTNKCLMSIVSRRAGNGKEDPETLETQPKWLPTTYNLDLEFPQFVSYFQHREDRGLDNHWICKAWNLCRGLDMHITNNLNCIVRLVETGPKIACKYVEDPVLFHREDVGDVKFDIRYIVLLSSVQPLKLYVYRVFWLRFANRPFSLDHLDDYQKHYTVMNYVEDGKKLKQVHYDDFIPMFDKQYPNYPWRDGAEESIFQMFRELFQAASALPPPQGIPNSPKSRAMYAIDLLLKWSKNDAGDRIMQPVICEVNYSPDCDRACKYHPNFFNDVFSTMFLDDIDGRPVTLL